MGIPRYAIYYKIRSSADEIKGFVHASRSDQRSVVATINDSETNTEELMILEGFSNLEQKLKRATVLLHSHLITKDLHSHFNHISDTYNPQLKPVSTNPNFFVTIKAIYPLVFFIPSKIIRTCHNSRFQSFRKHSW